MKCCSRWAGVTSLAILLVASAHQSHAQGDPVYAVPVVMEEATVRGKVAVLETRWEDRRIMKGLRVQVWSTKEQEPPVEERKRRRGQTSTRVRDVLINETETDDLGLFDLPMLPVGEYLLNVSEVQFRLTVIPKAESRAGQSEPKVLLILIPKEVIHALSEQKQGE